MITLDLSILNQKGTPMFNSDLFANRPAAGIVGRIFISTDTNALFRDTGSTWVSLGGGGGTIAGSIGAGQVAFGTAANTIGGVNTLFWDSVTERLGIGTNSPGDRISVLGNTNSGQLVRIQNQSGGNGAVSGLNLLSDTQTGGIYLAGSGYTTNGVIGANSVFLYGAGSTNLAIAVNSSGYFAIGTGSVTPTERLRLTNTGNLLIGQTTDAGVRLFVNGSIGLTNFQGIYSGNNSITFESFRMQFTTAGNTLDNQYGYNFSSSNACLLTSGSTGRMIIGSFFTPSAGNAAYTNTLITSTINQTGGANGVTQGLVVNANITNAPNYRGIVWDNNVGFGLYGLGTAPNYFAGNVQIGSTTPIASDIKLQVTGRGQFNDTRTYTTGAAISFAIIKDLTINSAISGSTGIVNNVQAGTNIIGASLSVPSSTTFASLFSYNTYQFASAGLTLTATQPGAGAGIRAVSQIVTQNVFNGANSGTISHVAGVQINGFYNNNTGTSTPIIQNAYQLLINDTGEFLHTFSFTNRWAIYQPGINDRNYLAGNLLLNSTTDTGQILQVNGAIRVNGQASGTAGGASGNHLIINVDGTQYKIALLNP